MVATSHSARAGRFDQGAPAGGDARSSAAGATEASIRRMVEVIVPLWMLAILANATSHDSGVPPTLVAVCAGAVAGAYVVFLRGWLPHSGIVLATVLCATAVAIARGGPPITSLAVFPLVVPWLNMATTVSGAIIPARRGVAAVVLVAFAGGLAVQAWRLVDSVVLSGVIAQALVGGACMHAGVQTLRQAAADRDRAAELLLRAESVAAAQAARVAEQRKVARTLHDTVINTLGAIRALPMSDLPALRSRCADDLAEIDGLSKGPASAAELIARLQARAAALGLDLRTEVDIISELPAGLAAPLFGALGEALVNAAKHSGSPAVDLQLQWDGLRGQARVCDHGRGFPGSGEDPATTFTGGGAQSILARCAEAGIAVRISNADGAVVALTWAGAAGPAGYPAADLPSGPETANPILGLAAMRVGLAMATFGAYSTLVTPAGPGRVGSAAAVIVNLAVVAWAAGVHRGLAPSRLPLAAYAVAVVAAIILPGIGMSGCARIGWYWWGPLAGLVVAIAVVLVDGRIRALAVVAVAYVAAFVVVIAGTPGLSPACSAETLSVLVLDLGIVIAVLALRRALIAQSSAAEKLRRGAWRTQLQTTAIRARDEVRNAHLDRAVAVCRPLLAGLAAGSIDPLDPQVRAQAGRAEATLRAVNSIPAELGELGVGLADAVLGGASAGVAVAVVVQGAAAPEGGLGAQVAGVIRSWVAALQPGAQVRVTLLGLDGSTVLMLTGPAAPGFVLPVGWLRSDDDGLCLLEYQWDSSSASHSAVVAP